LSADDFEPYRGDTFVATVDDVEVIAPLDFVLSEVLRVGAPSASEGRHPFSLSFHGPPTPLVAQGIHHLAHPTMGQLDIFLVPIAADQDKIVYQAVFN
jgi:hypothetical protein